MPGRGVTRVVLCVAGEASGDALLAPAVARLATTGFAPAGVGGDRAVAAGLHALGHARDLAAHGLVEAAGTLPAWLRARRALLAALPAARAAVLVDFPELNLRLLRRATRAGVPVAWLAPPQAWAWRAHRAAQLRAAAWVGCLLGFEAEWYRARGVPAEWVGHPLAARPPLPAPATPGLALLPGSRDSAVRALLPVMLAAAARLRAAAPGLALTLAVAPTVDRLFVRRAVEAADLPVALFDDAPAALAGASVALAGAGTATLEAALAGRPPVALARLHRLSAAVARRLVQIPHVALPNLVLGRRAFPERILDDCTAPAVAAAAAALLAEPAACAADLAELRARCHRPDGAEQFAERALGISSYAFRASAGRRWATTPAAR